MIRHTAWGQVDEAGSRSAVKAAREAGWDDTRGEGKAGRYIGQHHPRQGMRRPDMIARVVGAGQGPTPLDLSSRSLLQLEESEGEREREGERK